MVGVDILVSETTANDLKGYAMLEAGALSLKGKTGRTKVFAAVGDERVAASPEFAALQAVHGRLVDTLRSRSLSTRKIAGVAKVKAAAVMDGLQEFYGRISRRRDHFLSEPAAENAGAAE